MANTYTHICACGHDALDIKSIAPIENRANWNKPKGGFWLSVNNGWETWCKGEMPEWTKGPRYEATLKPEARILEIWDKTDLQTLPVNPDMAESHNWDLNRGLWGEVYLDFEKLADEYDGIAVMVQTGNWDDLYHLMYGWDCDSLCVFNPEIIEGFKEIEPCVCKMPSYWSDDED